MPSTPRIAAAVVLCLVGGLARAASVDDVEIRGLDEAMTENVRISLSLSDSIGRDVSGRRLGYMLREAANEAREALEPFGYYSPRIVVERSRDGERRVVVDTAVPEDEREATRESIANAAASDTGTAAPSADAPRATGPVSVTITIEPGEPVRVRRADIAILGDGSDDRYLSE